MALQQVEGNEVNPMWGMLANMGAHVAGNTGQNNVMSAIGESVSSGLAGHKQVMEQNANKRIQAQNLMTLINESRRYEKDKAEERSLKQEELAIKREHLDILRQKAGDKKKGSQSGISQKMRDKIFEEKIMPYIKESTEAGKKLNTISSLKDIASKDLGVTQAGGVPLPGWVSAGIDIIGQNTERWTDRNKVIGEVKGSSVGLTYEQFMITSNFTPQQLADRDLAISQATVEAVERRFLIVEAQEWDELYQDLIVTVKNCYGKTLGSEPPVPVPLSPLLLDQDWVIDYQTSV